jgi:hypothetical protein
VRSDDGLVHADPDRRRVQIQNELRTLAEAMIAAD